MEKWHIKTLQLFPRKQENNNLLVTYKPYSCSRAAAASLRAVGYLRAARSPLLGLYHQRKRSLYRLIGIDARDQFDIWRPYPFRAS